MLVVKEMPRRPIAFGAFLFAGFDTGERRTIFHVTDRYLQ